MGFIHTNQLNMTINLPSEHRQSSKSWTQIGCLAIAILFNICLVAQLLTVGLAVFYDSTWWSLHVWLVRSYAGSAVLLFIGLSIEAFPRKIKVLAGVLVILLGLQFITSHFNHPLPLGVLHPLIGFSLFTSSTTLVHLVWREMFKEPDPVLS